jgi:dephospho-CoA kinase
MDKIVVVHCDPQTQRARLLARPGMDEATASMLLERQLPQSDKIARADFLVSTDHGVEAARDRVRTILAELRA